jgi:hypothetical protein
MADERKLRLTFNALDLNGDGELDAAELTKVRLFSQHFCIGSKTFAQFYLNYCLNQKTFGFLFNGCLFLFCFYSGIRENRVNTIAG